MFVYKKTIGENEGQNSKFILVSFLGENFEHKLFLKLNVNRKGGNTQHVLEHSSSV